MSEICTNKNSPVFAGLFFIIVEVGGIESQLLPRRHLARSRPRLARFVYSRNMSAAFNSPTQSAQALCSLPLKNKSAQKALMFLRVEVGRIGDYIARYFSIRPRADTEKSFNSPARVKKFTRSLPFKNKNALTGVNVFASGSGEN